MNFLYYYYRTLRNVLNSRTKALHLRSTIAVARLTEHDDVIRTLIRGAPQPL